MAVDPNIKQKANNIRTKQFGSEVRESLATGLESMSEDVVDVKGRQLTVEGQFQTVIEETTGKDIISAPEIIAARGSHSNLSQRLLSQDEQLAETSAGLSFALAKNLKTGVFGSTEPRYLDNIGDGYLYGSNSRSLYRTATVGGSWELITTFTTHDAINGIRMLGDGEVLLIRSTDGLWKSVGWANNPLTATWKQVLVTNGRTTQFSVDVDTVSSWVSITTYINGDMTNSRYVWLSKDNGTTFEEIFDMLDYEPTINKSHSHMHLAVLDPYWSATTPRIWISYHKTSDDPTNNAAPIKRIKYSDNGGQSWVDFSNATYQPVAGIATPEGMIFGSDEDVVGVYIVRRTANPADMKYELFYAVRENLDGIFGWATKVIKGENGAFHMSFRSSVAGFPARVITTDGTSIAETLQVPPATTSDTVDLVDIVEYNGQLLGTYYNTATGSGVAYKVTADVPTRGLGTDSAVGGIEGGVAGALGMSAGLKSQAKMRGTAVGSSSKAEMRGTAVGEQSLAGAEGVAVGSETKATGNGTAVGKNATTDLGVAIGRTASATSDGTSVGTTAKSIAESVAIGSFATAEKTQTTAVGRLAVAGNTYATAVGALANANNPGSVAIGRNSKAAHDFSVALGYGQQTTAANQVKIGNKHIEGNNVTNPSTFPVDGYRMFSRKNASEKTELCVLFPTGSPIVIATEQ